MTYFLSYCWRRGNGTFGFSNSSVRVDAPIDTMADVRAISLDLAVREQLSEVTILTFQELAGEQCEDDFYSTDEDAGQRNSRF